jgi:hypothetical protein
MTVAHSSRFLGMLALLAAASGASACNEDFPLGSWGGLLAGGGGAAAGSGGAGTAGSLPMSGSGGGSRGGNPSSSGGSGAAGSSGASAAGTSAGGDAGDGAGEAGATAMPGGAGGAGERPQPVCLQPGAPGPLNAGSPGGVGTTGTYTDWTWPSAVDSMEWTVTIETDYESSGYYYAYQLAFTEGQTGFFGLQAGGGYQTDPPSSPIDFTKIAVFWIAAPAPMRAELGDIAYPNARTYLQNDLGSTWWTIHARYDWQPCRSYRLRIGPESRTETGSVWFGAWVYDPVTEVETFIGRMLLPENWGLLSPFTSQRTSPIIRLMGPTSCDEPSPSSVLFSEPTGNGGRIFPRLRNDRFASPANCGTSRFTDFEYAVRQELGVAE